MDLLLILKVIVLYFLFVAHKYPKLVYPEDFLYKINLNSDSKNLFKKLYHYEFAQLTPSYLISFMELNYFLFFVGWASLKYLDFVMDLKIQFHNFNLHFIFINYYNGFFLQYSFIWSWLSTAPFFYVLFRCYYSSEINVHSHLKNILIKLKLLRNVHLIMILVIQVTSIIT